MVVLDANGVGYAIFTSFLSASQAKMGEEATFYTWLYVREDVFDLYGFYKPEELSCFKLLLTVSGVGPKAAIAIFGPAYSGTACGGGGPGGHKSFVKRARYR